MTRAKASDLSERELLEAHAKALEAQVEGLRAEVERAQRIMQRAISWLQIKEAAFATAKGPAIIEEMQRFCAGSPVESSVGARQAETIERLRAALAEVAGLDCSRYTKYLDAQEHCSCVSCSARKALRDAEQADAPR